MCSVKNIFNKWKGTGAKNTRIICYYELLYILDNICSMFVSIYSPYNLHRFINKIILCSCYVVT